MKHYKIRKRLLFVGLLCLGAAFPFCLFLWSGGSSTLWLSAVFSAAMLLLSFCAVLNTEYYLRQTVLKLSDLLSSITELRENPVFSDSEDTLLSKLQNQTLRLTGILQAQQQDAQKKEQEMKTLVSDISHQLKTPVAALKMYSELLWDETATPKERREYLETLMTALHKLEFLMDSLIKMSRLESHIIQLKAKVCPISSTVLAAVMQCHAAAKQKNMDVSFAEPEQEILAAHDVRWTQEAIFNLLDNGVKYTQDSGKMAIKLQKYEMFCRIDITDNGPGIPEGEQEKIFQRFYRGTQSKGADGLGIGLYLTRNIISGQGGYIKLSSGSHGSTFSVFLPLSP